MLFQQQRYAGRHGIARLDHILDELLLVLAFIEARRYGIDDRRAALVQACLLYTSPSPRDS